MLSDRGQLLIDIRSSGSTAKGIKASELKKIKITFPSSIDEQIKIAKILSTWDKAIETTEQLLTNSQQQKKALMQQLLAGKKRSKNYDNNWKSANFEKLFFIENEKKTQVKNSEYLSFGKTPIVDQGQKIIAGFTNKMDVYSNVPVIIFGDHTRIIKWVNFIFAPGADGTQIIKTKEPIDLKFGFYLLSHIHIQSLGYSRHMRVLKEKIFKFPVNKKDQKKIAAILNAVDLEIENLNKQITCLKHEKKSLMQQLLTGKRRVKIDSKEKAHA